MLIILLIILQVILSVYFLIQALTWIKFGSCVWDFKFDPTTSPENTRRINEFHIYVVAKYIDLLDTVFHILRKKSNLVTFLHVYHHAMTPLILWLSLKFTPMAPINGVGTVLNAFVHMVMYSYFALAACGPSIQRYLWWKRYITQIQLVQFIVAAFYFPLFAYLQRGYNSTVLWFLSLHPFIFFALFMHFYRVTYSSRKEEKEKLQ